MSWHLFVWPFLSYSLSSSASCRLLLSPSLSLSNNADPLDRLQPTEEDGAMLGHLCVSMCVQAFMCSCIYVCICVCVAVSEDGPCQKNIVSIWSPMCFRAVAVIEVFSFSGKKKDRGEAGSCSCTETSGLSLTSVLWVSGLEQNSVCVDDVKTYCLS